jgi:hypothetical protein
VSSAVSKKPTIAALNRELAQSRLICVADRAN